MHESGVGAEMYRLYSITCVLSELGPTSLDNRHRQCLVGYRLIDEKIANSKVHADTVKGGMSIT